MNPVHDLRLTLPPRLLSCARWKRAAGKNSAALSRGSGIRLRDELQADIKLTAPVHPKSTNRERSTRSCIDGLASGQPRGRKVMRRGDEEHEISACIFRAFATADCGPLAACGGRPQGWLG